MTKKQKRKNFPLRIDPKLYEVIQSWAEDEFRSVNSHIEFLLRESVKRAGRLPKKNDNKKDKNKASMYTFVTCLLYFCWLLFHLTLKSWHLLPSSPLNFFHREPFTYTFMKICCDIILAKRCF